MFPLDFCGDPIKTCCYSVFASILEMKIYFKSYWKFYLWLSGTKSMVNKNTSESLSTSRNLKKEKQTQTLLVSARRIQVEKTFSQ